MNGLAIDSGVLPACAHFRVGELIRAAFDPRPTGQGCDWIVVEQWQFRGAADLTRSAKLIRMMTGGLLAAGHASAWGAPVTLLTPREWKGTEPKPAQHARMWAVLSPAERAVLGGDATRATIEKAIEKGALSRWTISGAECYPSRWTTHNLLDAAALGLVLLGRLEKKC